MSAVERQVTRGPGGRILTNVGVWSPDGEWIVYDTRSDAAGETFDGATIEMVSVRTGETRELYRASRGARCGVATFHPREWRVVFILGPEDPTPDWSYCAWHRRGIVVDVAQPDRASVPVPLRVRSLDARDVDPPFTPGALRGGTHVHVWDASGGWVSFTYEDHVLATRGPSLDREPNRRNVGVCAPGRPVTPRGSHPRNHAGEWFSVLATRTVADPRPGSDEIRRAFEEAWVGVEGYLDPSGTRRRRALAFQGEVVGASGEPFPEVFIVDLPDDVTLPGDGPLEGTESRMPRPPKGTVQRRLTHTAERPSPGIGGPRHWLRSSPDGARIAFLMEDDAGIVQLWTVSPNGGPPRRLTRNPWPIASAFTWSPDGRWIAHVADGSVCVTDATTGETRRVTDRRAPADAPRPEACVVSPDGRKIAYVRRVAGGGRSWNQIFVASLGRDDTGAE